MDRAETDPPEAPTGVLRGRRGSTGPGSVHPTPWKVLRARLLPLTVAVILTGVVACDNVAWEGVELRIEAPATTESDTGADTLAEPPPPPPLDLGPLLFVVDRGEAFDPARERARLVPVASLEPEGLTPLPPADRVENLSERLRSERMEAGRRFVLFSGGRRAGTFVAGDGGSVDRAYCAPRPTSNGRIEVLPPAVDVERFLALPEELGEAHPYEPFARAGSTRAQREASLDLAAAVFVTREIRWPPSVLGAREDIRVFRPRSADSPVVAATFLYGDSLAVGPAPPPAYSLFLLGEEDGAGGWDPAFVRYREVGLHGKEATRFVDHLDWDDDGRDEVLLEIFGATGRWFAALRRGNASWEETFDEGCRAAEAGPGAAGPPGDRGGAGDDPGRAAGTDADSGG